MSAVEKDSQVDMVNGDSVASPERAIARKLPSHNGRAIAPQQLNRLPAFRDSQSSYAPDVRRYLSERSQELQSFITPLEDAIKRAQKYRSKGYRTAVSAQAKVASLVLETIRRIAHRETGVFNLEAPVAQLLSCLCAGSLEAGVVSGLVRRAQRALATRDALQRERGRVGVESTQSERGLGYDVGREIDELTMLLTWYVRRKMSLAALELDSVDGFAVLSTSASVSSYDERDALFGLEVMHDHQVFGCKGCSIACGLRLVGRDGQPLWLRVSVLSHGEPVAVRPEWSTWTDPGNGQPVEVLSSSSPFCSLVPIRANAQRLVIDEIRAFVPYGALHLPAGRREVELVVSVVDNEGHEVVSATSVESICIPPRELSMASVPAPHSVGMWPHDVVSGDKISELSVSSGFTMLAGWEYHAVSVQFDLSLFMHAGESVMLECRFVDSQGHVIELSSLGIPFIASEMNVAVESVSSYRYRRVLRPKGAWAVYQGLRIDIPVEFLLLDPGYHDISCELVIVSSDDRVLCGDMSRMQIQVPARSVREGTEQPASSVPYGAEGESARGESNAVVALESIEIDSASLFAGEETIRIEASFTPRNTAKQLAELAAGRLGELFAPYRVEISLEREDGHVLLQAFTDRMGMSFKPVTRTVCIDGQAGLRQHRVVANFAKREVLGWSLGAESLRAHAKVPLFARITALTLDGEIIQSSHKEFFVRPAASEERVVTKVQQVGPTVVDLVATVPSKGARLSAVATVNMPAGEYAEEGAHVSFVLRTADGVPREIATKQIAAHHDGLWTRQVTGLTQVTVGCESASPEAVSMESAVVEVVVRSVTDEVLARVQAPVQELGVLHEVESLSPEDDSTKESEQGISLAGVARGMHHAAQRPAARKGFFKRLFS